MLDWYPLSFNSDGGIVFQDQLDEIRTVLANPPDGALTDLWILSYGWNTSIQEGNTYYQHLTHQLRDEIQMELTLGRLPKNYSPMFIGIYWPSEILADTTSKPTVQPAFTGALAERTPFINAYRSIFDHETGAFTTIILVGKQLQRHLLTRIIVGFSP
jgi:hypothetical protein